jgi:hypothetical protein
MYSSFYSARMQILNPSTPDPNPRVPLLSKREKEELLLKQKNQGNYEILFQSHIQDVNES